MHSKSGCMMEPVVKLDSFSILRSFIEMLPPSAEALQKAADSTVQMKHNSSLSYTVGKHQDNEYNYKLTLCVKVIPEDFGWSIDMEIAGIFTFPEGTSAGEREGMIRVNGCTILYGLLRGHLASVTGAFPSGPYVLPTVNMYEVVKAIEESKKPNPTNI